MIFIAKGKTAMKKSHLITSFVVSLFIIIGSLMPVFAYSKEETIYTKLKTNGQQKSMVVSQHLINDQKETTLEDQSELFDIKNVGGKETFKQEGNKLIWQTKDGQDIYYQGKTKATLPISMKVTYKLNGKEMKLKKMLGKKGKVEIRIDYTNQAKKKIEGKELYVPFLVTTGTILSNSTNSHIEVTNGKVMSQGSSNVVMALALPGLAKNYDNNKDLQKYNSVTIKYETKKFKLNSLMSVASPSLLSDTDINFDDMNEIYSSVDTLNQSFDQIISGGQALQSGLHQYASKYNEFNQGVGFLNTGIQGVLSGTQSLTSGLETLYQGLGQLDGQSTSLTSAAKQVFDYLLNITQTQINEQLKPVGMSIELTTDNYQTQLNSLIAKVPTNYQTPIKTALSQLDSYHEFYQGLQNYTGAVGQLKEGTQNAVDGSKQLSDGITSVASGSDSLENASNQLKDASNQLAQGSDGLVEGLTLFKSKGLDKISDVVNNTIKKDMKTTERLISLSKDYKTLTGSKENIEASTKFVMVIDAKSKK